MSISIIIPSKGDTLELKKILPLLKKYSQIEVQEIIVVESQMSPDIEQLAKEYDIDLIESPISQRAYQLNLGASRAKGKLLYFLHADSMPPKDFVNDLIELNERGIKYACFRLKFIPDHPILSFYAFFTRFRPNIFRGGDQSLFVERSLFWEVGGYNEAMDIMEDYDIISRLKKFQVLEIVPKNVETSSRKYMSNGILRLQFIYLIIQIMYRLGISQSRMQLVANRWIK